MNDELNWDVDDDELRNRLFEMANAYGPRPSLGYLTSTVHVIYIRYHLHVQMKIEYIASEESITIEISSGGNNLPILGYSVGYGFRTGVFKTHDCDIPNLKFLQVTIEDFAKELEKLNLLKEFLLIHRAIMGSPLFIQFPRIRTRLTR